MEDNVRKSLQERSQLFGYQLAERRRKVGLTLKALANRTEISVSYLNNLENAFQSRPSSPTIPSDEKLERLADVLEVSFFEINSWLERSPAYFDDKFWQRMCDAGFRRSLPSAVKDKILVCIQSAVAEDNLRERQYEAEWQERRAEQRKREQDVK